MKKILVISEQDVAVIRLNELYHSLYAHEKKELYFCSIQIVDCVHGVAPPQVQKTEVNLIRKMAHPLHSYLSHSHPVKILSAISCKEIVHIIKKYKINTVLVPHFIYDTQRSKQYEQIIKDIKKNTRTEVIGLYI